MNSRSNNRIGVVCVAFVWLNISITSSKHLNDAAIASLSLKIAAVAAVVAAVDFFSFLVSLMIRVL